MDKKLLTERFLNKIRHVEYEAAQRMKKILVTYAKELFGDNFPKTDFLFWVDGANDEIKEHGILIDTLEPTGSYLMMLPEGLFSFMPHSYFGKRYPRRDLYSEAQPETYLKFGRKALSAMETAYRQLKTPD